MKRGRFFLISLLLNVVVVVCCSAEDTTPLPPEQVQMKAAKFLKRYGYMKVNHENDAVSLEDAIKTMQTFYGLNETGVLDDATVTLMKAHRCSLPDVDISEGKAKRYCPVTKWNKYVLDYKIFNYPSNVLNLTNSDVDRIVDQSLKMWSGAAKKLSFPVSTSDNATLKIRFAKKSHGDNNPFDGPGNAQGHGFYPRIGDIHFDDDETWSDGLGNGANLLWVAIHEFGHVLGLGHSNDSTALMYPLSVRGKIITSLSADDVAGIVYLYPN